MRRWIQPDAALHAGQLAAGRLQRISLECRLTTVSKIIRDNNLAKIDLLKIDAERSELEILARNRRPKTGTRSGRSSWKSMTRQRWSKSRSCWQGTDTTALGNRNRRCGGPACSMCTPFEVQFRRTLRTGSLVATATGAATIRSDWNGQPASSVAPCNRSPISRLCRCVLGFCPASPAADRDVAVSFIAERRGAADPRGRGPQEHRYRQPRHI